MRIVISAILLLCSVVQAVAQASDADIIAANETCMRHKDVTTPTLYAPGWESCVQIRDATTKIMRGRMGVQDAKDKKKIDDIAKGLK